MNWEEKKSNLYYIDGSYRDIVVLDTTTKDWEEVISFLEQSESYKVIFDSTGTEDEKIDFNLVKSRWDSCYNNGKDNRLGISVYVDTIRLNAHFFSDKEIEFDLDPKEIKSPSDDAKVMSFIESAARVLHKEVLITPENDHSTTLLSTKG
ncbi:MAG: hypothetical protein QG636_742 [Patescibacteria group bacterium]|nr:hypothetical protein [Patescibacteria group bacterium]